jgi:hypothetical protein
MRILDIQGHETSLEAPELEAGGFPNSIEVENSLDPDAGANPPPLGGRSAILSHGAGHPDLSSYRKFIHNR